MTRPLLGAMRTHACGSLRAADAGQRSGWTAGCTAGATTAG